MEYNEIVSKKLRELRESHKLRQEDIAKIINVQRNTYNQYENNKRRIDIDNLGLLADYYKISLDKLTGRVNY